MGVKNLKKQNQSLLMKWLWRYTNEEHSLWRRVITDKYGEEGPWKTKAVNNVYGVSVWKTIRNLWQIFSNKINHRVGNGQKIFFWQDNWMGQQPLKTMYPDIFIINQQQKATINEVWSVQGGISPLGDY